MTLDSHCGGQSNTQVLEAERAVAAQARSLLTDDSLIIQTLPVGLHHPMVHEEEEKIDPTQTCDIPIAAVLTDGEVVSTISSLHISTSTLPDNLRGITLDMYHQDNYHEAPLDLSAQEQSTRAVVEEMAKLKSDLDTSNDQLKQVSWENKQLQAEARKAHGKIYQTRVEAEERVRNEIIAKEDILEQFQELKEENAKLKKILKNFRIEMARQIATELSLHKGKESFLVIQHERTSQPDSPPQSSKIATSKSDFLSEIANLKALLKEATIDRLAAEQAEREIRIEAEQLKANVCEMADKIRELQKTTSQQSSEEERGGQQQIANVKGGKRESDNLEESGPDDEVKPDASDAKETFAMEEVSSEANNLSAKVQRLLGELETAKQEGSIVFHDGNDESMNLRHILETVRAQLASSNTERTEVTHQIPQEAEHDE
jgi:hypothetical protein